MFANRKIAEKWPPPFVFNSIFEGGDGHRWWKPLVDVSHSLSGFSNEFIIKVMTCNAAVGVSSGGGRPWWIWWIWWIYNPMTLPRQNQSNRLNYWFIISTISISAPFILYISPTRKQKKKAFASFFIFYFDFLFSFWLWLFSWFQRVVMQMSSMRCGRWQLELLCRNRHRGRASRRRFICARKAIKQLEMSTKTETPWLRLINFFSFFLLALMASD